MPRSKAFWIDLPDTNVWLALVYDGHQHHQPAMDWFGRTARGGAALCRITQMGLLRLLTNSKLMGQSVLNQGQAWEIYDLLRSDERVAFLAEKGNIEPGWRRLMQSSTSKAKGWTDTYLAALAQANELRLVTFDRGFRHLKELPSLILGDQ
jgi:toxin-antitoxin system PIN domain toxin